MIKIIDMNFLIKIGIFLFYQIYALTSFSYENLYEGIISKVIDGDTVYAEIEFENGDRLAKNKTKKIRLVGIDAPEISQPFGKESKAMLESYLLNLHTKIYVYGSDRYKRLLAKLVINEKDINLMMVHEGGAWFYVKYKNTLESSDQKLYEEAHYKAMINKQGLWGFDNPISPWEWRIKN
jgi:micrococcal nuclease